jgi:cytidylate kinase
MVAITISRQMGSLGSQIADETAKRLRYKLVWREAINQAALRAGVPEMALATIDELDLLGIRPNKNDQEAYQISVRQVLHELANEGDVVIVGRAGQIILKGIPDVLHIRVVAPKEIRVVRIEYEKTLSHEIALALVEKSDLSRGRYLKRFYQADIDNPNHYDLVINTERIRIPEAAELICTAIKRFQHIQKS